MRYVIIMQIKLYYCLYNLMQDLPVICIVIFSINQCNSHYTNKD